MRFSLNQAFLSEPIVNSTIDPATYLLNYGIDYVFFAIFDLLCMTFHLRAIVQTEEL